jgi:hypothetical protein
MGDLRLSEPRMSSGQVPEQTLSMDLVAAVLRT